MPGSMSGEEKRNDGLLGERSNERRCAQLAPPVLYVTALLLDSTTEGVVIRRASGPLIREPVRPNKSEIRSTRRSCEVTIVDPGAF